MPRGCDAVRLEHLDARGAGGFVMKVESIGRLTLLHFCEEAQAIVELVVREGQKGWKASAVVDHQLGPRSEERCRKSKLDRLSRRDLAPAIPSMSKMALNVMSASGSFANAVISVDLGLTGN